jgi:hypothetical protein
MTHAIIPAKSLNDRPAASKRGSLVMTDAVIPVKGLNDYPAASKRGGLI